MTAARKSIITRERIPALKSNPHTIWWFISLSWASFYWLRLFSWWRLAAVPETYDLRYPTSLSSLFYVFVWQAAHMLRVSQVPSVPSSVCFVCSVHRYTNTSTTNNPMIINPVNPCLNFCLNSVWKSLSEGWLTIHFVFSFVCQFASVLYNI